MKKKLFLLTLIVLIGSLSMKGQKEMSIAEFRHDVSDLTARENPVLDVNNKECAVIKIITSRPVSEFSFECDRGASIEKTIQKKGEIWLTISSGAKFLTIKSSKFRAIDRYSFSEPIRPSETYIMKLVTETSQNVRFICNIPTATLTLNGENKGVISKEGFEISLPFGEYDFVVSDPKYIESQGRLIVNEDGENVKTFNLQPLMSTIMIRTNPEVNADIYIGGSKIVRGQTPKRMGDLAQGNYMITLRKENFKDISREIMLGIADNQEISMTMVATKGRVILKSKTADAKVFVNGDYQGVSSDSIFWVEEGKVAIRLEKSGYSPIENPVFTIKNGESKVVVIDDLQPKYGQLKISSNPTQARIKIDGVLMDVTPKTYREVLVGKRTVSVELDGFDVAEEIVEVKENELTKVSLKMKELRMVGGRMVPVSGSNYFTNFYRRAGYYNTLIVEAAGITQNMDDFMFAVSAFKFRTGLFNLSLLGAELLLSKTMDEVNSFAYRPEIGLTLPIGRFFSINPYFSPVIGFKKDLNNNNKVKLGDMYWTVGAALNFHLIAWPIGAFYEYRENFNNSRDATNGAYFGIRVGIGWKSDKN